MRINVTIAAGASLSAEAKPGPMFAGKELLAIQMPAVWTGAAPLTVQASFDDGATFQNVFDDSGTEVEMAADAGRLISLTKFAVTLGRLPVLKIRSGTAGAPVVQAAERILTLHFG